MQSSSLVAAFRGERWGKHGGKLARHVMVSSLFCWLIISIVSTAVVRSTAWKHETHMIIPVIYRLITRKHITESYFYLAVSREKHRKQATRVWEELAQQNVERWQSDDGSTPPSRCAQATIQSNCNAIGRDDIALGWGCMRLNERRGWSSLDVRYEAVVVISHLACQLRCFLMARSSCLNRYLYVGIRTWTRKSAEFNFPPLICCGFRARRQESNLQLSCTKLAQ